jgi:hypothetical protein
MILPIQVVLHITGTIEASAEGIAIFSADNSLPLIENVFITGPKSKEDPASYEPSLNMAETVPLFY